MGCKLGKILLGKVPRTKEQKEIVKLKKRFIILIAITYLLVFVTVWTVFVLLDNQYYQLNDNNININYTNLNQSEIKLINSILNQTKPIYLTAVDEITFTKNLSDFYWIPFEGKESREKSLDSLLGFNQRDKIYILYEENEVYLKMVLCHEMLHSYLRLSDKAHEVVYDLTRYLPCYEVQK